LLALRIKRTEEKNNEFAGFSATATGASEAVLLANIADARRCRSRLCWQHTAMAH